MKKKNTRKDGYVLHSLMGFAILLMLLGIAFNTVGCGGGGGNNVIPTIPTNTPNNAPTETPVPFPTDNTVTRLVVTTQNPPRPNGKVTANLLSTSENGEIISTQVEANLDGNGAGTIDLKKNSNYDANLFDQSDFANPIDNKQVVTGNDGLQNLTWDGGVEPTPTNTPPPGSTPTNTPDPVNPTPTNTPVTPVPTVDPPNPGTPSDFATLEYMGGGICYNPNNQNFYVTITTRIDQFDQNGQFVRSTTGWGGGGVPPAYNAIAFNPTTSQIAGVGTSGRLFIFDDNLNFIKRGYIPSNCADIAATSNGDWIIANNDAGRLEFYVNSFNNEDVLNEYSTLGVGILSSCSGFKINYSNQYVCSDSYEDLIRIINSNNALDINISQGTGYIEVFQNYVFAPDFGTTYIYNIDTGSLQTSFNNSGGSRHMVIVDREIYYVSSTEKKVKKVVF